MFIADEIKPEYNKTYTVTFPHSENFDQPGHEGINLTEGINLISCLMEIYHDISTAQKNLKC